MKKLYASVHVPSHSTVHSKLVESKPLVRVSQTIVTVPSPVDDDVEFYTNLIYCHLLMILSAVLFFYIGG